MGLQASPFAGRLYISLLLMIISTLTFIRVMVTLLTALPKSVSCYENVICLQKFLS